jgi:hypothetical protein
MIRQVLERAEFLDRPPVLLDIGAAGAFHPKWRKIARYSICIAFDADQREMNFAEKESGAFRKLFVVNRIVTAEPVEETEFHLTRSPQCSSLLKPNTRSLRAWAFSDLFEVEKTVPMKATTLPRILDEIGVGKVDWFKADSQGTDLRLFDSLGPNRIDKVLVAEFEPGIIDAYEGEDKLWNVLAFMDSRPFWMADIVVKGSQRVQGENVRKRIGGPGRAFLPVLVKTSPGWCEVTYMNAFRSDTDHLDQRDYLLGWVFAVLEHQLGFAMEMAVEGSRRFGDPLFKELEEDALSRIRRGYFKLPFLIAKRIAARSLRSLRGIR